MTPSAKNPLTQRQDSSLMLLSLLLSTLVFLFASGDAQADKKAENKIKAALIDKLPKFVQWPEMAASQPSERFSLCVFGQSELKQQLLALDGRKTKEQRISVDLYSDYRFRTMPCKLAFITRSESNDLQNILASFADETTLTVSDIPNFAQKGGMVEIFRNNKRLGLKINNDLARQAGLILAAPLLEIAHIVQ